MTVRILQGDCRDVLKTLPDESVHCVVTSPPYFGLRDYGVEGQIGLEQTPEAYVARLMEVFLEVRRVLREDGTLWLNLGDSYASGEVGRHDALGAVSGNAGITYKGLGASQDGKRTHVQLNTGLPSKNLIGIPWRVAFALQADGWRLRQDIIWSKPNPMPESVTDRCTKAHEYIFLFAKSERYYFDADAIAEPTNTRDDVIRDRDTTRLNNTPGRKRMAGLTNNDYETRNKRSVWTVATQPYREAHFATFPPALIESCILAGATVSGWVLDPFGGAGTTGLVADRLQRNAILIELNPEYAEIARSRIIGEAPLFAEVSV